MSEPTQEFLRRGQVLEWLAAPEIGIPRSTTKEMIQDGTIKGEVLPLGKKKATRRKGKSAGKSTEAKNGNGKHHPPRPKRWMRFRKSQIKEALKIQ